MSVSAAICRSFEEAGEPVTTAVPVIERFQAVSRGLYRYVVVRLGGDAATADDVMQDVWIEANRGGGPVPEAEWEAWLRGVARNLLRQHWRKAQRRAALPTANVEVAAQVASVLDQRELPDELLARQEVRDQILLALTTLPAADQEVIVRHHFRGEPQSRIAEELGCSARAVEGRLYRARRALREALSHLDPNEASFSG